MLVNILENIVLSHMRFPVTFESKIDINAGHDIG